ncbi:hypothetical protein ACP70R_010456 [Stipagrostis hirtigluma subsp. patula]
MFMLCFMNAFEYVLSLIEVGQFLYEIEICTREEFYSPFLSSAEGFNSVHEFYHVEVRPMYAEANHWQITALVNALGIPLILENLDRSLRNGVIQLHQVSFCPRQEPKVSHTYSSLDSHGMLSSGMTFCVEGVSSERSYGTAMEPLDHLVPVAPVQTQLKHWHCSLVQHLQRVSMVKTLEKERLQSCLQQKEDG